MRLIYFLLIAIAAISCQNSASENIAEVDYFFNLESFINEEITRLNTNQPLIQKRILLSGKDEIKKFDSLDYKRELTVFAKADINKVAWTDKYEADSIFQNDLLTKVSYSAKDKDLKTQLLEVTFDEQGNVQHIFVRAVTESIVADVYKDMNYWPGKGYKLSSTQSTALSEATAVEVEATFLE